MARGKGMSGEDALAISKSYTEVSLLGGGAVRGKNCIISGMAHVDGGTNVTFSWTLDDGTVQTGLLFVKDGVDGITPQFSMGTVEVLPYGSTPQVTITGTAAAPVLNIAWPEAKPADPITIDLSEYYKKTEVDAAVEAVAQDLADHAADTDAHVTPDEKAAWDGKADPADIPDITGYATEVYVNAKIAQAQLAGAGVDMSGYYNRDEVDALVQPSADHAADADVHVTPDEKAAWDAKADPSAVEAVAEDLADHAAGAGHVSDDEKAAWDAKADPSAVEAVAQDLADHAADADAHTSPDEKAAWDAKADPSAIEAVAQDLADHAADTTAHVTDDERQRWNTGGGSAVTMSQDDYNALTEDEKNNGTVYYVLGADGVTGTIYLNGKQYGAGGGASGVTAPVNGFFTLVVEDDGNLYAYSADDGTTPAFEYDEATGALYYLTEEGTP